jgi:hypothetical protein
MFTINEFCVFAKISQRIFDVLKAQGLGPQLTRVGRRIFISHTTAHEWVDKRRG